MSGFAFQKLNGGQTTANKQLIELEKANGKLAQVRDRVAELADYVSKPEIWKLARMFHPDAALTPVQWSWHMAGGGDYDTGGKLYYGRLQVSLAVDNFKDRSRQWVDATVWNNGNETASFRCMHYKSSHGDYPSVNDYYIGYVDCIRVWSNCDSVCRFEFQGFEVGVAGSAPPPFVPPAPDPDFQMPVHGLSSVAGASVLYLSDGIWKEVVDGAWPLPADATHVRLKGVTAAHQVALYYGVSQLFGNVYGDGSDRTVQFPANPLAGDVDVVFAPMSTANPPNPSAPAPPTPPPTPTPPPSSSWPVSVHLEFSPPLGTPALSWLSVKSGFAVVFEANVLQGDVSAGFFFGVDYYSLVEMDFTTGYGAIGALFSFYGTGGSSTGPNQSFYYSGTLTIPSGTTLIKCSAIY